MIKWVHLGVQARSEQDFELLTKLLDALGLQGHDVQEYKNVRLQSFLPSLAALEVVHRKVPYEHADLEVTISDPDSAVEVIKKMGLEIIGDHSGPEPRHASRSFGVQLPGGTKIRITGIRSVPYGFEPPGVRGNLSAEGKKFAIVASRFNSFIVERLLSAAVDGLMGCGADRNNSIQIVRVPGSFEIPSAARTLAETKRYDAIICLGCLLRGETAHYDVIVNEVTRGIGQSAQETGVPHAFGVLTCDTLEQAIDRAGLKMGNKGFEAALAAVEMANLKKAVGGRRSLVVSKIKIKTKNAAGRRSSPTFVQKKSTAPSRKSKR
jgi:6,7-dimethyl-8-ribityllumazine synthase